MHHVNPDLFVLAAEPSGDLHGEKLLLELLKIHPRLKISAVSGPKMRKLPITSVFPMEKLQVMGFIDVFKSIFKLLRHFFFLKNLILKENPKVVLFIDYPGFHLRLQNSLRKKGFSGKLIHYISPTVWAWGKKRIPLMEKNLDLLFTFFPFEKKCYENTSLNVEYIGHPLAHAIASSSSSKREPILALFPGSRTHEIEKNLPLQLKVASRLKKEHPDLKIALSIGQEKLFFPLQKICQKFDLDLLFVPPEKTYDLMKKAKLALATSGTVTLELALHETPTVVNYAIHPFDQFLAQKIFSIQLPYYCIVNLILNTRVFPELFGSNLNEKSLFEEAKHLLLNSEDAILKCKELKRLLGEEKAEEKAAKILEKFLSVKKMEF